MEAGLSNKKIISLIIAAVLVVVAYTQLTIFVVQPIGALPQGRTLLITRLDNGAFIDSPDAMCKRIQGYVNLLCRSMAVVAAGNNSIILLRLPYSEWLYKISTGGETYDR